MDAPGALSLLLQALGIIAVVGGAGALAWARMGARIEAVARDSGAEIAAVHSRINDVREQYVRRDDWRESLQRIEAAQRDAAAQIGRLAEAQHATARTVAAVAVKLGVQDPLPVPRSAGE